MSFYHQNTISFYSWFLLVLSCNIFLMTFHGSIFLNIKLGPTTTSSPRRRGRGLHNPDSSHDQIRCFWLAEVRNFTNIMIEYFTRTEATICGLCCQMQVSHAGICNCIPQCPVGCNYLSMLEIPDSGNKVVIRWSPISKAASRNVCIWVTRNKTDLSNHNNKTQYIFVHIY